MASQQFIVVLDGLLHRIVDKELTACDLLVPVLTLWVREQPSGAVCAICFPDGAI